MPDTSVKLFHSGMVGAPTLNGLAGTLIAVLDACLVNGFGAGAVDSISIAGGVATATRAAGHPFEVGSVVEVAGATVSGGTINGQHRVTEVTSTTYKFPVAGLADQLATGTPTHKIASAGWDKPFSGTNLAAYRSADTSGARMYLRVNDTTTLNARVRGYEAMSDINTGAGLFPTEAQISGGAYWPKSADADASSRRWAVVADTKFIYFACHWLNSSSAVNFSICGAFGDLADRAPGDNYAACLFGCDTTATSQAPGYLHEARCLGVFSGLSNSFTAPRTHAALGTAVGLLRSYASFGNVSSFSQSGAAYNGHLIFPNPSNSGLYLSKVACASGPAASTLTMRGRLPGFYAVPQIVGANVFTHLAKVSGVDGYPGREFTAINSQAGVSFFDTTGPWE